MEEIRLYDINSIEFSELIDAARVELKIIILNIKNCKIKLVKLWRCIQICNYFLKMIKL